VAAERRFRLRNRIERALSRLAVRGSGIATTAGGRTRSIARVHILSLTDAEPFTTKDGSTIRELHHTIAQSLAEASLDPGQATERHYHARTEEIYLITGGGGVLEVDGETRDVRPGDAVLIPPGAWHELAAGPEGARLLCMCVPPYSHDDTFFA
jgi:quercetin dioxygenase-like cupin family protein